MVLVLKYSCCVICFPISLPAISAVVAIRCDQKCRLGSIDWVQRILCILEEDKAMSGKKKKANLFSVTPLSPAQPQGGMGDAKIQFYGQPTGHPCLAAAQDRTGHPCLAVALPSPRAALSSGSCTSSRRSCTSTTAHLGMAPWGHLCNRSSSVTDF